MRKFIIAMSVLFLGILSSCSAQEYVVKGFQWDYPYFAQYPDNSVYFVLYQKADPDTVFAVFDTTEVNATQYDVLDFTPLYNFTYREWYVTAILHEEAWADSQWSFESAPSNTVRVYFKALPPAPIDSTTGIEAVYVPVEFVR